MGYAGGTTPSPTYRRIGDHSETLQLVFDPTVIGYEKLLEHFWQSHDPTRAAFSRQYRAAVFYHNPEHRRLAEISRERLTERLKRAVRTRIEPAGEFHPAEDYHQKYILRRYGRFMKAFEQMYPDPVDLAASTAAARVNGYLGGYGSHQDLMRDVGRLGLTEPLKALLIDIFDQRRDDR